MIDHPTHSTVSTVVADALAATPSITNVTHARDDGHPHVQFHCRIDGDPTDVTVLETAKTPHKAIQAAYNATTRDTNHCLITSNKLGGTRIKQVLRVPIAESTDDGIRPYAQNQGLEHDGAVAVTEPGTESPTWWIRGTAATENRDRICELKYNGRVLATYDLEDGMLTLEDDRWATVEQRGSEQSQSAIAPRSDHHSTPQPAEWDPVRLPLIIPSTSTLTNSAVYALSDTPADGVTPVNAPPVGPGRDDQPEPQRVTEIVTRILAQRTVESPTATIAYEEFKTVLANQLQAEDQPVPQGRFILRSLTQAASVTIQQRQADGQLHRQLRGRTWAVPPSASAD